MSKLNITRVAEFHDVSGLTYRTSPGIPDGKKIDLRMDLLREEMNELETAANQDNIVEVLDALVDIQYILDGAILDFGLQDVFEEAQLEVHRSNMSKFCLTTQDARECVNKYYDKDVEAYYKLVNGKFVIRRSNDEKILKGSNYEKPNLKPILERLEKLEKLKKVA